MRETITFKPSLVIRLRDAFTGDLPQLPYVLRLKGAKAKPYQNRLGDVLYFGLETKDFELHIESAYFQTVSKMVSLASGPLFEIRLYPSSLYPFPKGSTLVRGTVTDELGSPLAGTEVKIRLKNKELSQKSDSLGFFVVFPGKIDPEDLIRQNGLWLLAGPDGGPEVEIMVKAMGFKPLSYKFPWPLGKIISQEVKLVPEGG